MTRHLEDIRNIGVIAHIDAGKTTVTERMLFYAGATHRAGGVDEGTTVTDDDAEEQSRGITIYSACITFHWKGAHINLIDTPGHVDFTAEVERCLRVLDGAVVVFSAREGVEAQSETVWRQADRYGVPRLAFINKLDREGARFEEVIDQMKQRLNASPVPIQIPFGRGPAHVDNPFRGVIDLIEMQLLTFSAEDGGKTVSTAEIPEDVRDEAEIFRTDMLEHLYQFSDEMMELAMEQQPIPTDLIWRVLREATLLRQIQPVLCGSALHGMGVQPVLDCAAKVLPSPLDRPPVEGTALASKKGSKDAEPKTLARKPDPEEPFAGLAFKVQPAKTGDMTWVRIYSGELKSNTRVLNPGKDKKENVAQLWQIHVTKRDRDGQIDKVSAGDIVGVIGLRETVTGDTLCDAKDPILLEPIQFPETVISMAIEPENSTERDKLTSALDMLQRQDPTLDVKTGESGQTLLRGMGELHLEIYKNRLLRDFNLNIRFHKPEVSYRETIAHAIEVTGECHRQIGGQNLFAKLRLRMEPMDDEASGVQVLTRCPPEELSGELLDATMDALRSCGESGGLISGYPLMKLRVIVLGAEVNETSNDVAFRIAANEAFNAGLQQGGPVLLEPIMRLNITTPDEYVGDFVGDLQQRRAIIVRTDAEGEVSQIEANAPLKELFGYSSAMRSLSHGRAGCSLEPLHYAPAPEADLKRFM